MQKIVLNGMTFDGASVLGPWSRWTCYPVAVKA